jgi:glycosyltransferase involved in cell wall biosynthesis
MRFSVIMASYLLDYPGAASNREAKFIRAVKSFLNQSFDGEKELLIVSDGCPITIKLYEENFKDEKEIKIIGLPKQELYSGQMRNVAIEQADGDIITYLDSDDAIGKRHLEMIDNQFDIDKYDWIYYDDYMVLNKEFTKLHIRKVETRFGSIGSSSISHKNPKLLGYDGKKIKWTSGYGHDWIFVLRLNSAGLTFKKVEKMPQYLVCHYYKGDF